MISPTQQLPLYLTPDEAADILRTTRKAIYVKIERRQLPGARRVGRKITAPKGGRLRYVPLTKRLAGALREHKHLKGARSSEKNEKPEISLGF